MNPRRLSLLTLLLALPLMAAPTVEVASAPAAAVEGDTVTIEVAYAVPEGPAMLHCEMKGDSPVVIDSREVEVDGDGVASFEFVVPPLGQARNLHWAVWLGEHWQAPLAPITYTDTIRIISIGEATRMDEMESRVEEQLEAAGYRSSDRGNVAVFVDELPGFDGELAQRYADVLSERYEVTIIDGEALSNPFLMTSERFDLLVLTTPNSFPAMAAESVGSFTQAGGHVLVLGGPAFETPLWKIDGEWLDRDAIRAYVAESAERRVFMDFEEPLQGEWVRGTNDESTPSRVLVDGPGADGSEGALLLDVVDLSGWDTFAAPRFEESPFGDDHRVLTFWVKGAEQSRELLVEIREADGTRWMATVPVTQEWRRVALLPSEFSFWADGSPEGRGGPGDRLQPDQAAQIVLGLAHTHSFDAGFRSHQIWIDDLATAALPEGTGELLSNARPVDAPRIEGVSPQYKIYPIEGATTLEADPRQVLWPQGDLPLPVACAAPHPRPQGTGIGKNRDWRFVPLVRAMREDGRLAGFPAVLVIDGRYRSCAITAPVPDTDWLAGPEVVAGLTGVVDRVMDGLLLWEGGAEYYAYEPGEEMTVGASVLNLGEEPVTAETRVRFDTAGRQAQYAHGTNLEPGTNAPPATSMDVGSEGGTMTVELVVDGEVIDHLEHPISIWTTPDDPQFMTAEDGDFILEGEKWYAHGVNYMPSSGVGVEDNEYFEFWFDPQPYDPDIIEWDLRDIKNMGMNMVSVFIYHRSIESRNLWDLLLRCRELDLKVNLSLRPGTPMDFPWDQVREMIESQQLADEDIVFAYDLAWEPFFGTHEQRARWDGEWREWIIDEYGSVEAAEEAWDFEAPTTDGGGITNPDDEHLASDGPWAAMAIDYRRFVDELVHSKYARARELVQTIDPNHLVSFRMTVAGDPTHGQKPMPYDLKGLAGAVDIMEPEGYGRIGDWERVKPGWFTAAYSRLVAPDTPVLWAEFGTHVWNLATMDQSPERLEFAEQFYRDFYEMALRSGANGTVCWWFPGGFRTNERSDYGIIDPDRSWRGISEVIAEHAAIMTESREIPEPTVWIEVERYAHPDGIYGIYEDVQEEFWAAIEAGEFPGLRWADE
ncbi:MAG: hypothetical protein GF320_01435 [Armatimonadia bacterium]|nr:hypothetical protein [Armatimonadia bacterium]